MSLNAAHKLLSENDVFYLIPFFSWSLSDLPTLLVIGEVTTSFRKMSQCDILCISEAKCEKCVQILVLCLKAYISFSNICK